MNKHILGQGWLVVGGVALVALSGCGVAAPSVPTASAVVQATAQVLPTSEVAAEATLTEVDVTVVEADGETSVDPVALDTVMDAVPVTELTEEEAAGLRFMREEEKLAHDVYTTLYEMWGLSIFQNIAASEQTHTGAVLRLLERYDVDDPVADNGVGVFADPTLQTLYDDLVAQGSESLVDTLLVGAAIEEIDILDLEERSAQTTKDDILTVYANLTKGSRNHLRSFVKTLSRRSDEPYTAQYLSEDAYAVIIAGDIERGNGRN